MSAAVEPPSGARKRACIVAPVCSRRTPCSGTANHRRKVPTGPQAVEPFTTAAARPRTAATAARASPSPCSSPPTQSPHVLYRAERSGAQGIFFFLSARSGAERNASRFTLPHRPYRWINRNNETSGTSTFFFVQERRNNFICGRGKAEKLKYMTPPLEGVEAGGKWAEKARLPPAATKFGFFR